MVGVNFGLVCSLVVVGSCLGAPAEDRIDRLPGWDDELPSRHYSGYLNISDTKHVHYYFVEKHKMHEDENVHDAPVVIWLNGGPGCSSLDGLFYEHGPFRINHTDPTKLIPFEYAWSKQANVLYIEAPVGVGFSYSDSKEEYHVDDDSTAKDNLLAVEKFFELYPELVNSDFYITGESYAGVYVPTLAEAIMFADKAGKYKGAKLRGIAVGNGCTGTERGSCSSKGQTEKFLSQYLRATALISPKVKRDLLLNCGDFSGQMPQPHGACNDTLEEMHDQVGDVNLYNIYGECHNGTKTALKAPVHVHKTAKQRAATERDTFKVVDQLSSRKLGTQGEREEEIKRMRAEEDDKDEPRGPMACIDSRFATAYLTIPSVIKALHVVEPPFTWEVCANQVNYTKTRTNLPRDTYPALIDYLDRVVIYNGDFDACVPYTDNQDWTAGMGFAQKDMWHPWTYRATDGEGAQVGGYAINYREDRKFTFLTVRGGRHEVPETAPEQAFELLRRVLNRERF
uniref:Carboxypeptidase n=1 Tax=Mucochytrium quahogii TaxID=96639 RepID=A0A7S2SB30_9STRA|mmetsp:Transcript_2648/g.5617  ORF Transcript_2648/g.5617 Transcript_2648/m.5617 type:complete len:511 (+) Transcript_2648:1249-2781(+)